MSTEETEQAQRVESLAQSINRLADVMGGLSPRRWGRHDEIDRIRMDVPGIGPLDMHTLAALVAHPEANEIVTAKCNHCERTVETRRIVAPVVACDACLEKKTAAARMDRYRKYWEHVCPAAYRTTDLEKIPQGKAAYREAKKLLAPQVDGNGEQVISPIPSFFLFGPTGTGKTRVAFLLLKLCLLRDQSIGVLWPEQLPRLRNNFDHSAFDRAAGYDVLLLDDSLLTACREPKLVEVLKQLVDVRMRENRPMIFTSQIGGEGMETGKEYGEATQADLQRVEALIRRLRETCKVIPFSGTQTDSQGSF